MSLIVLLLVVVIVVAVFLVFLKAKGKGGSSEIWPFYAKKPLSQPEQVLYFRLIQALPEHIILAQVQLSRLLRNNRGTIGDRPQFYVPLSRLRLERQMVGGEDCLRA
jgi:hypothetical protein